MRILYAKITVPRKAKVEVEAGESSNQVCVIVRFLSNNLEKHVQQAGV